MERIPLIADRDEIDPSGRETWDWIASSRGSVALPFQILLHRPGIARAAAELGAQIRFASGLSDRDRELLIVASARTYGQSFEWTSHLPLAEQAGVSSAALACLEEGTPAEAVADDERVLIEFVREFASTSQISDASFERLHDRYGTDRVVEISTVVGYYSLLACVMNTCAP